MLKTRHIIALTSTLFLTIAISTISCKKQSLTSNQINDVSVLKTRGINYPELGVQFYETYTGIANNSEIEDLLNTNFVKCALIKNGYSLSTNQLLKLSDGTNGNLFIVDLNSSVPQESVSLLIEPISEINHFYRLYISKSIIGNSTEQAKLLTFGTNLALDLLQDNWPNTVKNMSEWRRCISDKWSSLTNTFSGSLSCTINPVACLAACVYKCGHGNICLSGGSSPTEQDYINWLIAEGYLKTNQITIEHNFKFINL